MTGNVKLSAANVRLMLTMKYLLDSGETPKCVLLARILKCSKPSIHKMIKYLDDKGLLQYKKRLVPGFTPEGLQTIEHYANGYSKVCGLLDIKTNGAENISAAVCAFLAECDTAGPEPVE